MSFDKNYPNRKDRRRPRRGAARFDHRCRCHGGCGYCLGNRTHAEEMQKQAADHKLKEFPPYNNILDDWFQCPRCGMISYNLNDIINGYCGACNKFFDHSN